MRHTNPVCRLVYKHVRRRMGVAAHDAWHDQRIDHAQARPSRRYQALRHFAHAPQLPAGYATMISVAFRACYTPIAHGVGSYKDKNSRMADKHWGHSKLIGPDQ